MTSLAAFDAFCQSLPAAQFVVQWGGAHVHKVGGKVFAIGNLSHEGFVFKTTPFAYAALREQELGARAPYLPRGNWIKVTPEALAVAELFSYLEDSHRLVAASLTRAVRRGIGLD